MLAKPDRHLEQIQKNDDLLTKVDKIDIIQSIYLLSYFQIIAIIFSIIAIIKFMSPVS